MNLYRAVATTADGTRQWHGRWHPTIAPAERQAVRWALERTDIGVAWIEQVAVGTPHTVARLLVLDADTAAITPNPSFN